MTDDTARAEPHIPAPSDICSVCGRGLVHVIPSLDARPSGLLREARYEGRIEAFDALLAMFADGAEPDADDIRDKLRDLRSRATASRSVDRAAAPDPDLRAAVDVNAGWHEGPDGDVIYHDTLPDYLRALRAALAADEPGLDVHTIPGHRLMSDGWCECAAGRRGAGNHAARLSGRAG